MATKRVIVHYSHEQELDQAQQVVQEAELTESFLIGRLDEAGIQALRDRNIVVEELPDEEPTPETPGDLAIRRRRIMDVGSADRLEALDTETLTPGKPKIYLIELDGPLTDRRRQEIEHTGVEFLEYIPRFTYTAALDAQQISALHDLQYVANVKLYTAADTGPLVWSEALIEPRGRRPGEAVQMSVFDIRVHTPSDLGAVTEWLTNQNVTIAGSSNRKIRIYLPENSRLLDQIAALTEVSAVQEYVPPKLSNDAARRLIGVVDPNANPNDVIAQRGANQIVGVADSGVDENHPDFQGRIIGLIALGRPNDPSDPHGHGTHVAGSVLGDGAASNSEFAGVAPDAELFFQSLLDASGGLGGLPVDLGNMFEEAYTAGARIHNNSWGADTEARYTFNSEEVDEFVWNHKDMLIVIAAGNDGRADANLHASSGFVDWLSVGSPATAKNALTVGASRSDRTTGGYSQITYGLAWPQDFPQPPIANENISGDPLEMAGFSSRGPSDDRRIKPDVVAPGTDIISAKASTAPLGNFWGAHANGQYAYMGGTSMAAPIVSGCATLARQYYIEEANWATPSAALLKATIINSARWLSGQHSQADNAMPPNYHQGFGQIFLPDVLPHPAAPNLRLEFIDSWQNSQHQFTRVGQRFRFNISVDAGLAFKICVVWTDRPGRGLQNSLGLILEDPLGAKHVGNTGRLDVLTTMDRDNNAQIVRFDNPAPGDYMIFLSAINLLAPPQDFALVVSGHLTSSLNEV